MWPVAADVSSDVASTHTGEHWALQKSLNNLAKIGSADTVKSATSKSAIQNQ